MALIGLNVVESVVAGHLKKKSGSIAMATCNVLKDWRRSQENYKVANIAKIYDALKNAEMNCYISSASS